MFPGKSTLEQLERVLEFTGVEEGDVGEMNGEAQELVRALSVSRRVDVEGMWRGVDEKAVDLIMRCLRFRPDERITAEEVLEHPYVMSFRVVEEELVSDKAIECPIDDNHKFSAKEYRNLIYSMIERDRQEKQK